MTEGKRRCALQRAAETCIIRPAMTVWIVNPFDNLPLEGCRPQRYWLMARAFARSGHATTYWTSDFSHARKAPRDLGCVSSASNMMTDDGFRLTLVPTMPYPSNICLRRIWSHRAFAHSWLQMAKKADVRPDVVIASLPPLSSCKAACVFCHGIGARFVVDIMDAWPETFYRLAPAWLFAPLRSTARHIYRSADAVTAVASRYLDMARSYGATSPMYLCHHGIELPERCTQHTVRNERHGALKLIYIGSMGASYDLETVVEAVAKMDDVELDLAGAGPKEPSLRKLAADCPRIRFHGYLGDAEVRGLLEMADAGIVPMFPDSCVGVPYKLADYAAAGLRVLNSLPGETEKLLDKFKAGVSYEAGNMVSFTRAVQRLRQPESIDAAAFGQLFDAGRLYGGYVDFIEKEVLQK